MVLPVTDVPEFRIIMQWISQCIRTLSSSFHITPTLRTAYTMDYVWHEVPKTLSAYSMCY
jgi:hypothetical protein